MRINFEMHPSRVVGTHQALGVQLVQRTERREPLGLFLLWLMVSDTDDLAVVERESRDVVEQLRELGRDVDYLVFDDEGHDVLKLGNRVRCYDTIVGFFAKHLS